MAAAITAGSYTVTLDVNSQALDSVTINSAGIGPATLAVGAHTLGVTGNGLGAADTVVVTGAGNEITIAGGAIAASGGIFLGSNPSLVGFGTLTGPILGSGTFEALGGNLDIKSNITSNNVTGMQIPEWRGNTPDRRHCCCWKHGNVCKRRRHLGADRLFVRSASGVTARSRD